MLFWKFGNPLIWPQELQRGGDVRREKSSGRSVMGIYSWVGAWNLNRERHCSGQVLRGGQTGCMLGKGGGKAGGAGDAGVGTGFFGNATVAVLVLWQDVPHEPDEDRKSPLQQRITLTCPHSVPSAPANRSDLMQLSRSFKAFNTSSNICLLSC